MWTKSNPVNWFEIPVSDLKRATEFYNYIFEINLKRVELDRLKMAWFPMTPDGTGATGTLVEAKTYVPSHQGSMVYFSVENIESVLSRISQKGGTVLNPKMSIGEHGYVAHFEDSEGNRVALHSTQ